MADTLQDFLVSLGFKVDENGQARFFNAIKDSEAKAMSLGKTVGKVGLAIAAVGYEAAKGTLAYAKSMEQLFYSARRTGASLENLKAIQLAGASLGATPESVHASVENVASFMRHNPGADAFLGTLGVQTKDEQGHQLDTVKIEQNLAASFQKMQEWQALQYGGLLGISDDMVLAMRSPDFSEQFEKYRAAEGNGVTKAGEAAHQLGNSDRLLEAHQFGLAAEAMTPVMNTLNSTIQVTNRELGDNNALLTKLMQLWATNEAMGGIAEKVGMGAGALWLYKKLTGAGAKAAAGAAEGAAVAEGAAAVEGAAVAEGAGALSTVPLLAGGAAMLYSPDLNKGEDAQFDKMRQSLPAKQEQMVYTLHHKLGMEIPDAIALTANFTRESSLNPKAQGDKDKDGHFQAYGLGQWHPDRQAEFAKQFGHTMQDSKDPMGEELAFAVWELKNKYKDTWERMQATGDARTKAEVVSRGYERPKDADGEATARGNIAQNINTTINVNGATDPKKTADLVVAKQTQVNTAARNSGGAFR